MTGETLAAAANKVSELLERDDFSHADIVPILGAALAWSLLQLPFAERQTVRLAHMEALTGMAADELLEIAAARLGTRH